MAFENEYLYTLRDEPSRGNKPRFSKFNLTVNRNCLE